MSTYTIAVIEDEKHMLENVVTILKFQGYAAKGFTDPQLGLEFIRKENPSMIISDIMMPEINGYQLLKEVQANPALADTPVIFMSAKSTPEDISYAMGLGASDYLKKPFHIKDLIEKVHNNLPNGGARA